MPQLRTIQSSSRDKNSRRGSSTDDPDYVNRLRQVLLKGQHKGGEYYHLKHEQGPKIVHQYNQHPPEQQSEVVYLMRQEQSHQALPKVSETRLPRIRRKSKGDNKKTKIDRSELLLIRNYMNANLVPFAGSGRRKNIQPKSRYMTVDHRNSQEAKYIGGKKIYTVHTPIKELENGTDNSSRTEKINRKKGASHSTGAINSHSLGKVKYDRIPNPQYYSSIIEIPKQNETDPTLRDVYSPKKERLGRDKSNQKSWEEINPLLLTTYFLRLRNKIQKSPSDSNNQSTLSHPSKPLNRIPIKEDIPKFIKNYVPQYFQIQTESLVKKDNFEILYNPEGDDEEREFYFGQIADSLRHGQGISIKDKVIFQGEWAYGQKQLGIEKTLVGTYKGEFKNGKRNGKGQYFWRNGEYYSGEWTNGKKNGSGYWKSAKDESYMGEWNNGEVSGYGVHLMKNGQRYEGQFKNFLKHGFGKEEFPNGDWYSGKYVQGKPHGHGKYAWKCGAIFTGEFVDGSREGLGKISWENIMQFEGTFKYDQPNGEGRILYPNGDEFNGNFQHGQKNGIGVQSLRQDRKVIKGKWKHDALMEEVQSLQH